MPEASAVFISYAHEDAEPARKIAEALRAFGVEVWFDTNELRGGDQWDAKIRRQIKNCTLFIPIISATTQSRREAYFRLEWKLADDRTHMMAPGTAFIVPVVIDDTPEYDAKVPDSFTKAHITRLLQGDPDPSFIGHVKALVANPDSTSAIAPSPSLAPSGRAEPQAALAPAPRKSSAPLIVAMSITGVLIALALVMQSDDGDGAADSQISPSVESAPPLVATTAIVDRLSIAVNQHER